MKRLWRIYLLLAVLACLCVLPARAEVVGPVEAKGCGSMFEGCENLRSADLTGLDISGITDMANMFKDCGSLESLTWDAPDTSAVTDMTALFYGCDALATLDVDLGSWDVSRVTSLRTAFFLCKSLTDLDLSAWDTAKVTDLHSAFRHCETLETLDVSTWNTGSVTDMSFLFDHCKALREVDLSAWNTGSVTDMSNLFNYCNALPALDLRRWDTGAVTDMSHLFDHCTALGDLDVSTWDTAACQRMDGMFEDCPSLGALDLRSFSTEGLTDTTAYQATLANCGAPVIRFTPALWDHPENPYAAHFHENALGQGGYTLYAPDEYRLYPLTVTRENDRFPIFYGTRRVTARTARLVCAAYGGQNDLLALRLLTVPLDGTIYQLEPDFGVSSAAVKVFLLNGGLAPMTPIGSWEADH